jgi:uncharacterized protein (UPF0333 family)
MDTFLQLMTKIVEQPSEKLSLLVALFSLIVVLAAIWLVSYVLTRKTHKDS